MGSATCDHDTRLLVMSKGDYGRGVVNHVRCRGECKGMWSLCDGQWWRTKIGHMGAVEYVSHDDAMARRLQAMHERDMVSHAVAGALGEHNVIRTIVQYRSDSDGNSALWVQVVLHEGAVGRIIDSGLSGEAFSAVLNLSRQLGYDGIPLVQYATQAELDTPEEAQVK